jgi:hypothetical protein
MAKKKTSKGQVIPKKSKGITTEHNPIDFNPTRYAMEHLNSNSLGRSLVNMSNSGNLDSDFKSLEIQKRTGEYHLRRAEAYGKKLSKVPRIKGKFAEVDAFSGADPQQFANGGVADWMKENKQGIIGGLTAAGGAALMATGVGGPLGASLVASGVGNIASEISDGNSQDTQGVMPTLDQASRAASFKQGGRFKKMSNGGLVEWQGGEPMMTPGGKIIRTPKSAPSHAQGGVTGKVPNGTAFLGQKINPITGNKFMVDGDKLGKIQNKADKTLSTSRITTARNSAMLNRKNAINTYNNYMALQNPELLAQGGIPKAADGLTTGYDPTDPNNPNSQQGGFGVDYANQQSSGVPNINSGVPQASFSTPSRGSLTNQAVPSVPAIQAPIAQQAAAPAADPRVPQLNGLDLSGQNIGGLPSVGGGIDINADALGSQNVAPVTGAGGSGGGLSGFLNKNGSTLASLAPSLMNLGESIFNRPDKERLPGQYSQGLAELKNRRFDIEPILDANRSAQQVYNTNVTQSGAGSGQSMAGRLAGMGSRMRADSQAYAQKNNVENQYAGQYAQGLFGVGQAQRGVDVANLQNQAAGRNMRRSGVSQLSRASQMRELMNNQGNRDLQRDEILTRAYQFYGQQFGDII